MSLLLLSIIYVTHMGFMLHYIGGDYSFILDIILLVHVSSGRRVVMVNSWVYVMTADSHVSRGSPLIGAARQSLPPANWFDQPRGWGSWRVDFRESGRILSYSEAAGVNCEMALRSVSGVK